MWSAHRDRGAESVDETTNVLNSLSKRRIDTLHQIRFTLNAHVSQVSVLTLTMVDITLRRLGTPIGTIPIMLNASIQNNAYGPSKNFFKFSQTG